MNNLPQIILFQEDEKALNYKYKLPFQLDKNIKIKSIEYDADDFKNSGVKLIGPNPTKDSIYFLHPYKKNVYIHQNNFEKHLIDEKMNLYREVGELLGAKFISTKVELKESKKLEISIDGKVGFKKIETSTEVKLKEIKKSFNIEVVKECIKEMPNFDLYKNIDNLNNMIEEFNLHHELGIISLIRSRDSRNSGVSVISRKITSEITSEYNHILNISAQLSAPVFSVNANFNRSLETVNTLYVDIEFEF